MNRSRRRTVWHALTAVWRDADAFERRSYLIGAALVASGVVHAAAWLMVGGPWLGPVSLRKAVTFGLAFGLTVVTVTWLAGLATITGRRRTVVALFVGACVAEAVLVSMQAWRDVPSHFNRDTAFDSAVSTVLAAGGAVIVVCAVLLTWWAVRPGAVAEPAMRLAIRCGVAGFDLALAAGVAMIARGVTLENSESPSVAYHEAGAYKPAHATTMHAILVLPLIAWLLSLSDWPERTRVRLVAIAAAGYALTAVTVVFETILAIDPLHAPWLPATLSAAGASVLVVVGLVAVYGVVPRGALRGSMSQ